MLSINIQNKQQIKSKHKHIKLLINHNIVSKKVNKCDQSKMVHGAVTKFSIELILHKNPAQLMIYQ